MRFTVAIPFASFEPGLTVTEADVFGKCPAADIARLVRLGSLVPPDGAVVTFVPVPVTAGEAELVADLQARLEDAEADRDLERETAARVGAERDALLKRIADLEGAARVSHNGPTYDGHQIGREADLEVAAKAKAAPKGGRADPVAPAKPAKSAPPSEPAPPTSGS